MSKSLEIGSKLTSSPWTSSLLINRKFCINYCSSKAVCTVQVVIIVELSYLFISSLYTQILVYCLMFCNKNVTITIIIGVFVWVSFVLEMPSFET